MIHLLDTSALKWAYIPRSGHHRRLRYILSRLAGQMFVAEISVLELVSALASEFRGGRVTLAEFKKANLTFLKDISAGRLEVLSFQAAEYIACRDLLTLAGVRGGMSLKTQDGMVLYTARRLAKDRQLLVKVLTSDRGMHRVATDLGVFKGILKCEYLPRR